MKESYGKGLATHTGPAPCGVAREGGAEASAGVRAGRVFSRVSAFIRGADAVRRGGRPYWACRYRETCLDPARSETPCTLGITSHGNREIPGPPAADGAAGRVGKPKGVRR
jgi:RNA-directed DNA polymerase